MLLSGTTSPDPEGGSRLSHAFATSLALHRLYHRSPKSLASPCGSIRITHSLLTAVFFPVPQRRGLHRGLRLPPQAIRQAGDSHLGRRRQDLVLARARPVRPGLVLCPRRCVASCPCTVRTPALTRSFCACSRHRPSHLPAQARRYRRPDQAARPEEPPRQPPDPPQGLVRRCPAQRRPVA